MALNRFSSGLAVCLLSAWNLSASAQSSGKAATLQGTPNPAQISYRSGELRVAADNASLVATLAQIARTTNIRISGLPPEEHIFGTYGPASPSEVIMALLKGTGMNVMVTRSAPNAQLEVVLTPQSGPATPPSIPLATASSNGVTSGQSSERTGQNSASRAPTPGTADTGTPQAAPTPMSPAERAAFIDRLQQQQQQVANRPH